MNIERIGTTQRWSDAVIHNHVIYMVEVPVTLQNEFKMQVKEVFSTIETNLQHLGSSKAQILVATIYLRDIQMLDVFNQLWDHWLPEGCAPVRACVEVKLANPAYLLEIQLTAAQIDKSAAAVNFMT